MGDVSENFDPPVYDSGTRVPRNRSTRPLLRQVSDSPTPREMALRRAIARSEAELAELESRREELADRFGAEPPRGTVIVFFHRYPGSYKSYEFAALRASSYWYLTGRETKEYSWLELCEFIGDAPFRVVSAVDAQPVKTWAMSATGKSTEVSPFLVAAARLARKTGLAVFPDEAASVLGGPSKSATEQALEKLQPFIVGREAHGGQWQVIDERTNAFDGTPDIVKTYPGNYEGEQRARQSVRDRNRTYRRAVRRLEVEPPVGSRVTSVDTPHLWARREVNGWSRYNGTTMQAARLGWFKVKVALGEVRPGTPHSSELIDGSAD
jgi:hypothetical protein